MSKLFRIVKWNRNHIEEMLKKAKGHKFSFFGFRIWWGIYIGIIDGRIDGSK